MSVVETRLVKWMIGVMFGGAALASLAKVWSG